MLTEDQSRRARATGWPAINDHLIAQLESDRIDAAAARMWAIQRAKAPKSPPVVTPARSHVWTFVAGAAVASAGWVFAAAFLLPLY